MRVVAGQVLLTSGIALVIAILVSAQTAAIITGMVDNAPKVFAARIGVLFSVVATILYAGNFIYAGTVVLGILWLCAALESIFSFCLGCWMYSLFPSKIRNVLSKEYIK